MARHGRQCLWTAWRQGARGPRALDQTTLLGFGAASADELALEQDFRGRLRADDQAAWSRRLTARAHHAGSAYDEANAHWLAGLLESWGYQVELADYDVLMPYPDVREVEMTAPHPYRARLVEAPVPGDPQTAGDDVLPPYNAFSADGNAEGELVYVNYGTPEDYDVLARYGIDVSGKIVIARYGKAWRGVKPKLAAEKGAIGALIYSDPADDGYAQGDVYPRGPMKPASGVQRGSVMDIALYPGDVLTPGRPAVRGVRRLARDKAPTIARIPVLPISYEDARPLLEALEGEVAPPAWRGALPITYHLGPGAARVHLAVKSDWRRIGIRDVIARWPGRRVPDEWVLRGNHEDAWNHGASDPVSGLVALLSEAKALAELARAGRPPARSVIYAVWDAEEPGLIGSTEWVEQHEKDLDANAVAYLNSDGNGRGFMAMGGSHTLEPFFNQVAADVTDPETEASVAERARAYLRLEGDDRTRREAETRMDLRLVPLGSGSDYTPFLQHAGIASASMGFGGESEHGSYHTLYDTYALFTRFRDPGFRYGVVLSELAGRATLRLANAPVLPFRFTGLADNLKLYVDELEKLAGAARDDAERRRTLLDDRVYALRRDPERTLDPPPPLPPVPYFNFAPLKNAAARLGALALRVDAMLEGTVAAADVDEVNRLLYRSERALTRAGGLPGRPWYRHQIYAPGSYTGYGAKTLPRVREAIEAKQYDRVDEEIAATAETLEGFADYLARLERVLAGGAT